MYVTTGQGLLHTPGGCLNKMSHSSSTSSLITSVCDKLWEMESCERLDTNMYSTVTSHVPEGIYTCSIAWSHTANILNVKTWCIMCPSIQGRFRNWPYTYKWNKWRKPHKKSFDLIVISIRWSDTTDIISAFILKSTNDSLKQIVTAQVLKDAILTITCYLTKLN